MHGTMRDMTRERSRETPAADATSPIPALDRQAIKLAHAEAHRALRRSATRAQNVVYVIDRMSAEWSELAEAMAARDAAALLTVEIDRVHSLPFAPSLATPAQLRAWSETLQAAGRAASTAAVKMMAFSSDVHNRVRHKEAPSLAKTDQELLGMVPSIESAWPDAGVISLSAALLSRYASELERGGRPLTTAERVERTRDRQRAGYVGRLAYDLHKHERGTLRTLGLLPQNREPTRDELQEAFRIFVRSALAVAEIPADGRRPSAIFERVEKMARGVIGEIRENGENGENRKQT